VKPEQDSLAAQARRLYKQKQYEQSLAVLDQASPDKPCTILRGKCLRRLGRFSEMERAMTQSGGEPDYYARLGWWQAKEGLLN
jgi:hypothetical protein